MTAKAATLEERVEQVLLSMRDLPVPFNPLDGVRALELHGQLVRGLEAGDLDPDLVAEAERWVTEQAALRERQWARHRDWLQRRERKLVMPDRMFKPGVVGGLDYHAYDEEMPVEEGEK